MAEDPNLAKSSQFRVFVQHEGSSPGNPYDYAGCLSLGGIQQDLGTGDPILCPSSTTRGKFDILDTTSPVPSLPTTDFTQHMDRRLNEFWWQMRRRGCRFNMAIVGSNCAAPDDPHDFQSKILVKGSKVTAFNTGAFNSLGEDAALDLTGSLQLQDFDRFLPLSFGETGDATVTVEAVDGMYADKSQCGDCGMPSDGCQKLYVLTINDEGEPGSESVVAHSSDGGSTWTSDEINSLTGDPGTRMALVGTRVVVVSEADEGHHYKQQSSIDADVSGGWTRVGTGYVTAKGPRAIWSKSPTRTYIVGLGGYIYLMANPTSAVTVLSDGSVSTQTLNDVRGKGNVVVIVGNSNAMIVSRNNGKTWGLVTGPAVGINLTSVDVISENIWFVTTANGKAFYTEDGGESWTENSPEGVTKINMIRFVDEMVGYLVAETSGNALVFRTPDNGNTWHSDGSYVDDVPDADRFNFVAACPYTYNNVLVGGIAATGTDGVVAQGAAGDAD